MRIEPKHYTRLNLLVTGCLPDLDDAKTLLGEATTIATIDQVACHLIVTSFYLELSAPLSAAGDCTADFHGMGSSL